MNIERVALLTKILADMSATRTALLNAPGYDAKQKADLVLHMSKVMVEAKRALRRECEIPGTDKFPFNG